MSDKYQNQYRIPSARLQNRDYSSEGLYFITICTAHRIPYFGKIVNGIMELSDIGKIVKNEWLKTFELRPDMNLYRGEFVVMPNHFHAVIGIGENEFNTRCGKECGVQNGTQNGTECGTRNEMQCAERYGTKCGVRCRDAMHCVSTNETGQTDQNTNRFGPQTKNLPSIIRGFKSAVTTETRKTHADFAWQSRYYDHIIRNDESFYRISNYIIHNPDNWRGDKFYNDIL